MAFALLYRILLYVFSINGHKIESRFHRRTASAIAKITQSVSKLRLHNRQKSSSQLPQKTILKKGKVSESDGRGVIDPSLRTVSYVGSSAAAGAAKRYNQGSQYRQSTSRYLDLEMERQRGLIKATPDLLAASASLMASEGTVQDVAWFISSIKLSALSEKRFEFPEDDKEYHRKREDHVNELWTNGKHQRMWTAMVHDLESALATLNFELAADRFHNLQSLLDEITKGIPKGVRSKEGKLAISLELEVTAWKSRLIEEVHLQMQRLGQAAIPLLKLLDILAGPVDCVEALIKIYQKRINVDKDLFAGQGLKLLSTTASRPLMESTHAAVLTSMDLGLVIAAALSEAFACLKAVYALRELQQTKATKKSEEVANSLLGAWALDLIKQEASRSFHSMIYHLSSSSSGLSIILNCAEAFVAPIKMAGRTLELPLESVVNSAAWSACEHAFQRKIRQINDNMKKLGSQDAAELPSRLGQAGSLNTQRVPNGMEWQTYFPSASRLINEVGSLFKAILPFKCLASIKSFRNGVSSLVTVS